ncbi:hypothetical protein ZG22_20150 [Salmonella enterica subsp. enterica serovar Typhimurium]|uniref:RecT protein n=1 Tax=Salmonella phage vB_SenS_ER19 TaxID=2801563 RepID=A0A7T8EJS8_9CAUD|nr:hypothetical protein [Salmonella enterica subsp. enterica serovar Stanley]ECJ4686055.1 hypothetical protein [Salmonella enterica subsp. enterica]ECN6884712.1 hypothetical protein [Salmonella enterica subsp. enterica serovar Typhimurium]ECY3719557.1 hypothetical protein [Salmonella enterica subsp. enterica serovar Bonariensis]EEC5187347.1 hypothetical protein [Salmonella enterica]QMV34294.1 hypothetical protein [Salmonella phage vB_SentM_sal2]QMV34371.1 hypothetical protein [Salmonella phag
MSGIFEQLLAEQQKTNTLLEGVLAALKGGAVNTSADAGSETTEKTTTKGGAKGGAKSKTETKAVKPKHTKDEVVAAVVAVKDAFGAPEAKKITAHFGLAKVAEAKEEHFDEIVEMCEAKLAEKDEGGNGEEDDV